MQALTAKPLQRIGLSATQRPLEEVARFLGGVEIQRLGTRDEGLKASLDAETVEERHNAQKLESGYASATDEFLVPSPYVPGPSVLSPYVPEAAEPLQYRPVTIVNASAPKQLKLRIEVPVEDMAHLTAMEEIPSGPAAQTPRRVSIWNAIHPRLLEIVRERNSTILFVNSRQVAERLAGALNELAGEPIARAHHGSIAAAQRSVIEEQLKAGQIKALCAT